MGWGQQNIRAFRELVDIGCTDEQIAEEMSLSLGAIATLRRKAFPEVLKPGQSVQRLPTASAAGRPKGGAPSDWTDKRVERLKELYFDGYTALQIANDLGGITRNAVIGKVHRLGLERGTVVRKKAEPSPRPPRPEPPAKIKVAELQVAKPKRDPLEDQARAAFRSLPFEERNRRAFSDLNPQGSRGVLIRDLQTSHCKWPMGDMMETSSRFCGEERHFVISAKGEMMPSVYCRDHHLMAYVPTPSRKQAPAHHEAPRR